MKTEKVEQIELFSNKEKKNFFKNENERNLWIKLNAEHIRYSKNQFNNLKESQDLGNINKPHSDMWVSNNQLTYDEYMRDAPRISFEEFLTLSDSELLRVTQKRNSSVIKKIFENLGENL